MTDPRSTNFRDDQTDNNGLSGLGVAARLCGTAILGFAFLFAVAPASMAQIDDHIFASPEGSPAAPDEPSSPGPEEPSSPEPEEPDEPDEPDEPSDE